jgi:superfamily II DNA helicase RecQ
LGRDAHKSFRKNSDSPHFAVYAQLRELRKSLSEQEGVPAYALFTNEQLAEMVRRNILTQSELAKIDGVGKAKLEKYGSHFVTLLKTATTLPTGKEDASSTD